MIILGDINLRVIISVSVLVAFLTGCFDSRLYARGYFIFVFFDSRKMKRILLLWMSITTCAWCITVSHFLDPFTPRLFSIIIIIITVYYRHRNVGPLPDGVAQLVEHRLKFQIPEV